MNYSAVSINIGLQNRAPPLITPTSLSSISTRLGCGTDDGQLAVSMQIVVNKLDMDSGTVLFVVGLRTEPGDLICCKKVTLVDGRVPCRQTLRGDLELGVCITVSLRFTLARAGTYYV